MASLKEFFDVVETHDDLEARGGIEPPVKVLQTYALPLGYRALFAECFKCVEPYRASLAADIRTLLLAVFAAACAWL